ncbi:hypothetical protein F2A31_03040 [Acinetobacter suaedae]|uniref:Uncharacterized protein n=1 Tax=Acinetobacter suaedae TaxID=2609668 RepID=A0A5P1UP89_9GAMM|nr:hypothetical protein [Acinetobacter sp. C16S1]QER38729.1 hypothetical protein F2A31_03040 [Acinetobacter sp. C16S1]
MGIPPRQISNARTSSEENNTHHIRITRKKQLFLLFYTTDNHRGDDLMYFSAKTRRFNIQNSSWYKKDEHLVFNIPIQDMAEIIATVTSSIHRRGGVGKVEIKEISIFSHAWYDGPTGSAPCTVDPVSEKQMGLYGWSNIDAKWAPKARFVMFGCNTASDNKGARVFAKDISECENFKGVEVWGQAGPAKPSFYPDRRDSSVLRNMGTGWSVNHTYMVASKRGDGLAATRGIPMVSPPALPMKKFMNGILLERAFQSQFNDHREN